MFENDNASRSESLALSQIQNDNYSHSEPLDFRPVAPINPASIEIEESVLGTILMGQGDMAVAERLPVTAFQIDDHRRIFNAILEVHKSGGKPNTLSVSYKMSELGNYKAIGGNTKLASLMERVEFLDNFNENVEILTKEHHRNQLRKAARQIETEPDLDILVKNLSDTTATISQARQNDHLEQEQDREADLLDAATELPEHLNAHQQDIDPHQYLWGDRGTLANAMVKTAKAMPTAVAPIFTTFIPASASCIDASSRVIASVTGKYTQPCIFWSMVVAPTGSLKTPTQKIVTDIVVELELEEFERYKIDLQDWQEEMKNIQEGDPEPPKPIRKRHITQDATIEALECILGENPGLLGYRDEIAGDFKAANAYRGGRGADEQIMLALWNGSAVIADRRSRQVTLGKSAFSRTGAIQFEVLQEICGNHNDVAGTLARFLVCAVDSPPRYYKAGQSIDYGLDGQLKSLFIGLQKLPAQDYFLTPQAEKMFERWQNKLVDAERLEKHSGIRAAYPKIEAYALRFSLWLHIVNSVLAGEKPGQQINGYVMKKAIELAKFFLGQIKLIYAVNSSQSGLGGRLLNLWLFAKKKLQGITPRDVKRNVGAYRSGKIPTNEIRQDCLSLVEQGYLRCEGNTFYPLEVQCHNVTVNVTTPVTSSNPVIESIPDYNVTNVTNVTTSDFEISHSQSVVTATPKQREEVVTFVPSVTSEPESLSGIGFGDVTTNCDIDCDTSSPEGSMPPGTGFATAPSDPAPIQERRMPEPHELASRLFSRGTWKAVLEELDVIATVGEKSRSGVFNKIKKYVTCELRRHLIQLLAEEMRWSRHNSQAWDWLAGCGRKLLAEATELAQAI